MGRWLLRGVSALVLPLMLLCTACSDPHSGNWAPSAPPSSTPATPSPTPTPTTPTTATAHESVKPLSDLEQWLLAGFEEAGYTEATVRVHGSRDAWVGSSSRQSAPERFAHAWPTDKTGLYADEGTVLRTTTVGEVSVQVLQHVWGVSARFECGQVTVDAYAQSQLEQHQAQAEALSLAGVLIGPLQCADDGFQG